MTALTEEYRKKVPVFDLGGSNTRTGIANFYSLQLIGNLDDEISNAAIVAKLESVRDLAAVEYRSTSEARQHLKRLMTK